MGQQTLKQQTTPSNPPAGYLAIYPKADGYLYTLDENGVEKQLLDSSGVPLHASNHTDGTDDIQSATSSQKGLATSTQITKLDGIEAGAEVTSAAKVNSAGAVMETDYNANTILAANAGDTPLALTVALSTFLGRKASGNIAAMSTAEARTLLEVAQHFGKEIASNSSITASSTTATTYQQKLRLALTSVPSGTYLLLWGCEYYNSYGDIGNIRVQLDDTTTIAESFEYDDYWADYRASMGFWFGALNGDHDFDIDYRAITGGSTEWIRQARLLLFRIS